jgi:hypothetical protein
MVASNVEHQVKSHPPYVDRIQAQCLSRAGACLHAQQEGKYKVQERWCGNPFGTGRAAQTRIVANCSSALSLAGRSPGLLVKGNLWPVSPMRRPEPLVSRSERRLNHGWFHGEPFNSSKTGKAMARVGNLLEAYQLYRSALLYCSVQMKEFERSDDPSGVAAVLYARLKIPGVGGIDVAHCDEFFDRIEEDTGLRWTEARVKR